MSYFSLKFPLALTSTFFFAFKRARISATESPKAGSAAIGSLALLLWLLLLLDWVTLLGLETLGLPLTPVGDASYEEAAALPLGEGSGDASGVTYKGRTMRA